MNILFLTLVNINNINERSIYADLLRKFVNEGHDVFIVSPVERRFKQRNTLKTAERTNILRVRTLNIQKTNVIEKTISTFLIESLFLNAIKKYFPSLKFDIVIYSTPPITFTKVIRYIKDQYRAKSYLLLKDIFPQNAVDLGMIRKSGILHRYFRYKEKQLYNISDFIGCMSLANVEYLLKNNPEINPKIVEVNPNTIELTDKSFSEKERKEIRDFYNIPLEVTTLIYGGNLGKPQGVDFLLEVLNSNKGRLDIFFVIVGSGTEYRKVQSWFAAQKPGNAELIAEIPKSNYDKLLQACDVGMIFLDKRFTIPNFPSRLLSYMEYKMPVIAATDRNTDIGKIMEQNKFGFWCESGDLNAINHHINKLGTNRDLIEIMGNNGFCFATENYTVSVSYDKIINHFI